RTSEAEGSRQRRIREARTARRENSQVDERARNDRTRKKPAAGGHSGSRQTVSAIDYSRGINSRVEVIARRPNRSSIEYADLRAEVSLALLSIGSNPISGGGWRAHHAQ